MGECELQLAGWGVGKLAQQRVLPVLGRDQQLRLLQTTVLCYSFYYTLQNPETLPLPLHCSILTSLLMPLPCRPARYWCSSLYSCLSSGSCKMMPVAGRWVCDLR